MNRILIVGAGREGSLENAYFRTFKKIRNLSVDFFDTSTQTRFDGPGAISRITARLITPINYRNVCNRLRQFLFDQKALYDAILICKGAEFSRLFLETCRLLQPSAIWANINPDDPLNVACKGSTNANIVDSIPFYDIYFIWSHRLAEIIKRRGARTVEYLPFGYDPDVHLPPDPPISMEPSAVSFVGAWDRERERTLTELADHNIQIFGNNWDRVSKRSVLFNKISPGNIYGKEFAKVISRSSVSLNLLRPQNIGAHNMRTFEIPAVRGLMLTTRSEEQNAFFPEEEACLMFGDAKELRDQLNRILSDPAWAQKIRERGFQLCQEHSYTDRAKHLVEILSKSGISHV